MGADRLGPQCQGRPVGPGATRQGHRHPLARQDRGRGHPWREETMRDAIDEGRDRDAPLVHDPYYRLDQVNQLRGRRDSCTDVAT